MLSKGSARHVHIPPPMNGEWSSCLKAKSAGTGVRLSGSTMRKRISPVAITPVFIPKSAIALSNLPTSNKYRNTFKTGKHLFWETLHGRIGFGWLAGWLLGLDYHLLLWGNEPTVKENSSGTQRVWWKSNSTHIVNMWYVVDNPGGYHVYSLLWVSLGNYRFFI